MAVLVITQKLGGDVLAGGGLAIAAAMLLLSLSGALEKLARLIPHSVVRGIQLGLGISLVSLALKTYVPAGGVPGYLLAAIALVLIVLLWGNRRFPPALPVIGLGAAYALLVEGHGAPLAAGIGFALPSLHMPGWENILLGFWLLAIPQLPLSLANSVVATRQTVNDLYPQRPVTLRGIGLTYSAANFVAPLFGGIPVCHGSGGLAGHYGFGARTGGSAVIYGGMYVAVGLLFGQAADQVVRLFPQPILGVVLLFEAVLLMRLARDTASDGREFLIALLVGALAFGLPHGFAVAMIVGTAVYHAARRYNLLAEQAAPVEGSSERNAESSSPATRTVPAASRL
jgi:MFS superfamily sulfate permease-like transporter